MTEKIYLETLKSVLGGSIFHYIRSKNYSYKYKADHALFFRIPLREEARYLLAYSYIYQLDLSSCGQALYLTV